MKKEVKLAAGLSSLLMLTSCLTVNAKKIVAAPYIPEKTEAVAVGEKETLSKIYFSTSNFPKIDGNFSEWKNLDGVHTHEQVYGELFDPKNADGFFALAWSLLQNKSPPIYYYRFQTRCRTRNRGIFKAFFQKIP